jgi:hypothetical protein
LKKQQSNFIGNKPFLKTDLLPALIAWRQHKPDNEFFTEASINLADDQPLMDLMVKAGFRKVFIAPAVDKAEAEARAAPTGGAEAVTGKPTPLGG